MKHMDMDKGLLENSKGMLYKESDYKPHYYGHVVRRLFFTGGIIMLLTVPFFKDLLPVPTFVSVLAILIVDLAAGLTNPRLGWTLYVDTSVAVIALLVFEYHAIVKYSDTSNFLFLIDQVLALIFFFALYYSVKTLRGAVLKD